MEQTWGHRTFATAPPGGMHVSTPKSRTAWADGLASIAADTGEVLEVFFADPNLGETPTMVPSANTQAIRVDERRGVEVRAQRVVIADLAAPPADAADAYLRLHLLSHRLVQPNTISLAGLFGVLNTVAWTNLGPVPIGRLDNLRHRCREDGTVLSVEAIDKFPKMSDYVIPSGVRIADARRVRLGAYLASGTVVMHEGFVNFNAGTLGAAMIEGRVSQGVVLGNGTDIGGGASVMGTLSGGGTEVIRIGNNCLLGANAGLGISLGDECIVEAGLYLTAGAIVTLPDGSTCKARDLSGRARLLFRRNSLRGNIEVLARGDEWASGLNAALHDQT